MPEPLDDNTARASADAEQAAYFRASLAAERQQLMDGIVEQRPLIERGAGVDQERSTVHLAEAEVRYLDRLIERLDGRFASHWQDGD